MSQSKGCTPWNKGLKTGIVPTNAWKKGHIPWIAGRKMPKGEKSFNWRGGRRITKTGYYEIRVYDSPNVHKDGYILEHRYVMEKYLGRSLSKKELVHHKNHNRLDNRIENLVLISGHSRHRYLHVKEMPHVWSLRGYTECIKCGSSKFRHYAKGLCSECYKKRNKPD